MKAKDLRFNKIIKIKKIDDLLKNNALINESKKNIQKGNLLIVKNVIDKNKIKNLKNI